MTVDPALVHAWLAARSIARGHPLPVADSGGWRVDTGAPDEARRYLFAEPAGGLIRLGREIAAPFVALKLCATGPELAALLPPRWRIAHDNWMMVRQGANPDLSELPAGFSLRLAADAGIVSARILDPAGDVAASGFAVEQGGVFIYDRIRTGEAYRRRGLGTALVRALGRCRRSGSSQEILTATPEGRALYLSMGWRDYSSYATAVIEAG